MDANTKLKKAEESIVAIMVNYAQSCCPTLTSDDTESVERYMELAGCNTTQGRQERRRIEANIILRDCICRVNRTELRKIEKTLMEIAAR